MPDFNATRHAAKAQLKTSLQNRHQATASSTDDLSSSLSPFNHSRGTQRYVSLLKPTGLQDPIEPDPSRINLLFICQDASPYGAQKSLSLLLGKLDPDKYHAYVSLSQPGPIQQEWAEWPHVTLLEHRHMPLLPSPDPFKPLSLWRRLSAMGHCLQGLNGLLALVSFCQKARISLIHTNSIGSLEGALVAKLTGRPHVWHIREWLDAPQHPYQLIFGRALTKRLVAALSTKIICVSQCTTQQFGPLLKTYPNRFNVIPNAVQCPNQTPQDQDPLAELSAPYSLAYVGKINETKRFQDILHAWVILKERLGTVPITLDVYGEFTDAPFQQWVMSFLLHYELGQSIRFMGYQADNRTLFQPHLALLAPSPIESFGRAAAESLAWGAPVIAANSGGLAELIQPGQTGLLYTPGDPIALANCLERLCQDPSAMLRLRPTCHAWAHEHLNAEQLVPTVETLYAQLY